VASELGQGSVFYLRFPDLPVAARLANSEKSPEVAAINFNSLRPSSLLIVDDNETNCDLISGMFAGSHHKIFVANDGNDAVGRAREMRPDVILMDIRMPGMSGIDATVAIRKIIGLEMVPVVAVTASSSLDAEKSLAKKFSGFIRKPFSKRELFDELAQFLPRSEEKQVGEISAKPQLPALAPAPKELLHELGELLIEPWPEIRDSVAVNESKKFAQQLLEIGGRWKSSPVTNYARKLLRDAENYAVTDLEKHLGEFSVLVQQLTGEK
jgi:CheY-like chemotaxis protein